MSFKSLIAGLNVFCCCCTMAQTGSIIGFDANVGKDTAYIISYDINDLATDTLVGIPNTFFPPHICCLEGSAFDAVNEIYYFSAGDDDIYSFDIKTKNVSYITSGLICHSPYYDALTENLIYLSSDGIKKYHLPTSTTKDIPIALPFGWQNQCSLGPCSAYNPTAGEYFFITWYGTFPNDQLHWILADVLNDSVLMVMPVDDTMFFASVIYSAVSNAYYGFRDNGLYRLSPHSLAATKISTPPADRHSRLNSQNAVFDRASNTYILPYYSNNQLNKIAVFDLNSNQLVKTIPYLQPRGPDLNQFISKNISASSDLNSSAAVNIYPNPADKVLQIHTSLALPYRLEIVDLVGRKTMTIAVSEASTAIPIETINSGMYIMHIHNKDQIISRPIVISH